jgi:hypothetical protein
MTEDCPECAQGKHLNCTLKVPGDDIYNHAGRLLSMTYNPCPCALRDHKEPDATSR